MGMAENIKYDDFPKQGSFYRKRVTVCFHYDTTKRIEGLCVRDDMSEPGMQIFQLADGRYVLSTECQWQLAKESWNG